MADNIHPVVELLAARMESHPEEFGPHGQGRWGTWLKQMEPLLTEEEKLMLRGPEMQDIHEEVLDELLNGEQRRAEEKRARDLEMQRLMSQAQSAQRSIQNNLQNALSGNTLGIGTQTPSQPLVIQSGGKEAMRIQANGDIKIGNETLNEGILKNIKKALGL